MTTVNFVFTQVRKSRIGKASTIACTTLSVLTAGVVAQDEEEEIFELSPFEVDGSDSQGYRATNTIAGTRINSQLEDVAAAISVVTEQQLRDLNAVDLEDVLVYTTGTETAGLGGSYSAAQDQGSFVDTDQQPRSPNFATRVRGLSGADTTRNLFLTSLPGDGYNIDTYLINRGPNAALFGLGQPGGIIDSTLKKAFWENENEVEFTLGRFNSTRAVLDINRVLIEDKLAIRLICLDEKEQFQQEPAYQSDERLYGAFEFKLAEQSTLRGNIEIGSMESNRPRTSPPLDNYTQWFGFGKPVSDELGNSVSIDGINVVGTAEGWGGFYGIVHPNPSSSAMGGFLSDEALADIADRTGSSYPGEPFALRGATWYHDNGGNNTTSWPRGGTMTGPVRSGQYLNDLAAAITDPNNALYDPNSPMYGTSGFWLSQQLLDKSVFDFRNNLLEGPNKAEWSDFEAYNLQFEQLFAEGKYGFELSYDEQRFGNGYINPWNWRNYAINVDTNPYIPSTAWNHPDNALIPNPNYGRPFIADSGWAGQSDDIRRATRATAFARHDFRENFDGLLGRLLGRHNLTGLYNTQSQSFESVGGTPYNLGDDYIDYRPGNWGPDVMKVLQVSYLGDSVLGASGPQGTVVPITAVQNPTSDLSSVIGYGWDPIGDGEFGNPVNPQWRASEFSLSQSDYPLKNRNLRSVGRQKDDVDSYAAILQSFFWNDLLVTTVGFRHDDVSQLIASNTVNRAPYEFIDFEDYQYVDPATKVEADIWNYGVVLHSPKGWSEHLPANARLSLFYNEAENFQPFGSRRNIEGEQLSPPTGETQDVGLSLDLWEGKLVARATWYETSVNSNQNNDAREILNWIARFPERLLRATEFNQWNFGPDPDDPNSGDWVDLPEERARAEELLATDFFTTLMGTNVFDYQYQFDGEGKRIAASHETTNSAPIASVNSMVSEGFEFELTANPLNNWTISFNASRQEAMLNDVAPSMKVFESLMSQYINDIDGLWISADGSGTVGSYYNENIRAPLAALTAAEGRPTQELREWRFNILTNYRFNEGVLNGWNLGGAIRWQDQAAIGYPIAFNSEAGSYLPDVESPYMAPDSVNVDFWLGYGTTLFKDKVDWRVQLNVKNAYHDDDLIPIQANPDGSITAVRIPEPTLWSLRNTFKF